MYDAGSAPASPGGLLMGPDFEEQLEELSQELYGKVLRRIRAKASTDEKGESSEFPVHTSSVTRSMEQAVALAPRTPRPPRRRDPFTTRSTMFEPEHEATTIPAIPAGTPGVWGVHSAATFKTTARARPKSAPAKNTRRAHQTPRDNLSAGGFQRTRSNAVFPPPNLAPAGGATGVGIKPQAAPHMQHQRSPNSSEHDLSAHSEDQNPALHKAIAQILSEHRATRSEGAVALSSAVITPGAATSLAYGGALDSICAVVRELVRGGEGGSTTCVQLLGVVFRVGAIEACCRAAAEAVCAVVGDADGHKLSTGSDSTRQRRSPPHRKTSPSDRTPGSQSLLGALSPATQSPGGLTRTNSRRGRLWGDTPQASVGPKVSEDEAEELVSGGTLLWVYPKSAKPSLSFVQLRPTGELFIQSKLQRVVVTGAMHGMSERLRTKASLTPSQRSGCFRLTAWAKDNADPSCDAMSDGAGEEGEGRVPRVFDLRAPAASDMSTWILGVTVIAQRNGTAPLNPEFLLHKKSFADLCCQVCGEELRKGVDSCAGERDELGHPRGRATATWRDGTRHIGMWRNDQPHGKGLLVLPGGERYVGEFEEGSACGYGVLFGTHGEKFEGEFVGNARDGFGCEYEGKRLVYCGGYREGLREGEGIAFGVPGKEGDPPPMSTCVYSDGVLEHSYELPQDDRREEKEAYQEAWKAASIAREAAVDIAKLLKEIQDLASTGSLH